MGRKRDGGDGCVQDLINDLEDMVLPGVQTGTLVYVLYLWPKQPSYGAHIAVQAWGDVMVEIKVDIKIWVI
jgi:hypothetical protein